MKLPLRSSDLTNIKSDNKYCFICSISASLHPCNKDHPNRVSNYRQNFNELDIEDFDFSTRFKCSDMHRFEKLNKLSINIIELNFYQDQNKWKHTLIPIEIVKK